MRKQEDLYPKKQHLIVCGILLCCSSFFNFSYDDESSDSFPHRYFILQ